jgi:hypothetical protein
VWRRTERGSTLDDVVEVLEGIGATLMVVSAKLDDIIRVLEEENHGETDA